VTALEAAGPQGRHFSTSARRFAPCQHVSYM
jgi:hypothetical protein